MISITMRNVRAGGTAGGEMRSHACWCHLANVQSWPAAVPMIFSAVVLMHTELRKVPELEMADDAQYSCSESSPSFCHVYFQLFERAQLLLLQM